MSEEGKSFAGRAADCWSAMRANPDRSMHLTSIIAGVLLFIGGLSGLINLLNPLGMVLSVYNIIFAGLILTSELKALPVFKTLNKRVDLYFHILSVPRGKAGFYVFVGILAFLGTHDWSISRICILLVAIVGAIQMTSHCIRGTGGSVEAAGASGGQPKPGLTSSMTGSDATAGANPFTSFAMEAVSDAPSLGRAGLSAAATFASTTAPATASSFGSGQPAP